MATVLSKGLIAPIKAQEALSRYVPPKVRSRVTFQSVAPGTTVRRGETINVRLVSWSDVPINTLIETSLPPKVAALSLEDVNEAVSDSTLLATIQDEQKMSDPTVRAQSKAAIEKKLGLQLTEDEAAGFFTAVRAVF